MNVASEPKKSHTGLIIAIVAGVLLIAGAAYYFITRKKDEGGGGGDKQDEGGGDSSPKPKTEYVFNNKGTLCDSRYMQVCAETACKPYEICSKNGCQKSEKIRGGMQYCKEGATTLFEGYCVDNNVLAAYQAYQEADSAAGRLMATDNQKGGLATGWSVETGDIDLFNMSDQNSYTNTYNVITGNTTTPSSPLPLIIMAVLFAVIMMGGFAVMMNKNNKMA